MRWQGRGAEAVNIAARAIEQSPDLHLHKRITRLGSGECYPIVAWHNADSRSGVKLQVESLANR